MHLETGTRVIASMTCLGHRWLAHQETCRLCCNLLCAIDQSLVGVVVVVVVVIVVVIIIILVVVFHSHVIIGGPRARGPRTEGPLGPR